MTGYAFCTFEELCEGRREEKLIVLRHDVDLKAKQSLKTAFIENELNIKASYYFRVVRQSNCPEIIKAIADLGHEIGYHYEDLSIMNGDLKNAREHFVFHLNNFREYYPVKTICMHGSPTSRFDNKRLWDEFDYNELGVIGEPYFDLKRMAPEMKYITDTGRMWDGQKYSVRDKMEENQINEFHCTHDLVIAAQNHALANQIMITTHPQRWTNNPVEWLAELGKQSFKNFVKKIIVNLKS